MIIRMLHLDLVTLADAKTATLEDLRALGAVHLESREASGADVQSARAGMADAESAVRLILKARGKERELEIRERSVEEVLAIDKDRDTLKTAAAELEREIRIYEPYGDFDPVLAKKVLDVGVDLTGVAELPEKLPVMRLSRMHEKLARIRNRIAIDDMKLAMCDEKAIIAQYPRLADQLAFAAAKETMGEKGALAFISGWVPAPLAEKVSSAARANGWATLMREPAKGEMPPTLIEPPKLFRPIKALFDGLGILPAYDETDVSVPFMCYFSLFFAMLVGDGAYGAIFLIIAFLLRRRLPKAWFVLLAVFSIATIGWGALSNTWFGAGIPWCADWPTVKWLAGSGAAPGHEYDNIMLLCFTIGATHLMLARLWNGICKLPSVSALAEFAWAGIVLFMYILTNTIIGIFPGVPVWAYAVFGVSFVTVFLSVKGVEKGMLFLNTMSALGDVISYVRLFAVGLASVKVAENFNSMAMSIFACSDSLWVKPLLAVAMALVLLAGHGLNLAMAGLSILVHAVRLNTLEFSNHKGVTWAGYAFRPFSKNKETTK